MDQDELLVIEEEQESASATATPLNRHINNRSKMNKSQTNQGVQAAFQTDNELNYGMNDQDQEVQKRITD